jgi:prepilin-type N-terminal cleavage/methylation domain-containing protein
MPMRDERGFTLVELLVSMSVTMVLMGAVYMAVNSAQRHSSGIERKVMAQQDVKPALDLMVMEIGMASYNPRLATNLWVEPPGDGCGSTAVNMNYRGIQEATANSITVEMDIGGPSGSPSDGSLGDPNEMIRYEYITRRTSCASTAVSPFLGAATGNTRAVRVINNTLGLPVFRYYDGTGTEIAATALPAAIPNIRRIDITLAVETENVDPNTNLRRRLIYSTSVIPRNHAISP